MLRWRRPEPIVPDVFNHFQFPTLIPERDWSELPLDAISYILRKLDLVELVKGSVAAVCSSWRRAARHEPELWRRIDISFRYTGKLGGIARRAVCLSAGQCQDFCGQHLDDDFLLFLAHRAPLLRCLRLKLCYGITDEGFAAAITNFPLLEELELDLCHGIDETGVFEHVARSCPRMKHITYTKYLGFDFDITDPNNDREALAIASMPELQTLHLFRDKLTNAGLASIIDNCPHLESLDLTGCRNITMDDALRAMCSRIKKKTILPAFKDHHASAINYRPIRTLGSIYWRDIADAAAKYIAGDDSVPKESRYSYCYYLGEDDEINLEYYDRILDKSMRRYKM